MPLRSASRRTARAAPCPPGGRAARPWGRRRRRRRDPLRPPRALSGAARRRPRRRAQAAAAAAAASSRACTTASGRSGPTSLAGPAATSASPTAWSIVGLLAAVAAELGHDQADRADVHRRHDARALGATARTGAAARYGRGARAGRPGRRARRPSRAKRSAAAPLRSASARVARPRASRPARAASGERERDLVQPRLARGAGQAVDRLAHLERVARGAAEHPVHVGQQRDGRQPGALATSTSARPARRRLALGHERARAELDVHHERVEPGGELLGQDRGDDQRDRLDGAGRVADRVQPAGRRARGRRSGRRSRSRPAADDAPQLGRGAAPCRSRGSTRACRACRPCGRGRGRRSSAPRRRRRRRSARG